MSELPHGWNEAPLGTVADIRVSNVDKKTTPGEQHVRLCNYMDVYTSDYLDDARPYMEATASSSEIARFGLQRDDVLITKDSETPDDIAIPAVVDQDVINLVCGYHLALLRPSGLLDGTWLSKQLQQARAQRYFAKMATGSTRYGLSNASIAEFPVWLPDLLAQKKASLILRTIDEAIRKTEQVIEKLKAMKQGLLHDLLTRGIDDNGELRPPPTEAPHLYKDSPLGMIPRGWSAVQLGTCGQWVSGGTPSTSVPAYWDGGVPWITAASLKTFWLCSSERTLTELGVQNGSRMVPEGTVLFVVRGMSLKKEFRVGVSVRPLAFGQDCKALVPNPGLRADFLGHLLLGEEDRVLRIVDEASHGTGRLAIPPLQAMYIRVPNRQEQDAIIEVLDSHEDRVREEGEQLAKLRTLKRGLMDDLLTGRVRVKVEDCQKVDSDA